MRTAYEFAFCWFMPNSLLCIHLQACMAQCASSMELSAPAQKDATTTTTIIWCYAVGNDDLATTNMVRWFLIWHENSPETLCTYTHPRMAAFVCHVCYQRHRVMAFVEVFAHWIRQRCRVDDGSTRRHGLLFRFRYMIVKSYFVPFVSSWITLISYKCVNFMM